MAAGGGWAIQPTSSGVTWLATRPPRLAAALASQSHVRSEMAHPEAARAALTASEEAMVSSVAHLLV